MKKQIVFICAGNTCRSPMAEALFRQILGQAGLSERFDVSSAGLAAFPGDGAAFCAGEVMREYGLDLSVHRSRPFTGELFAEADWIVAMTQAQKQGVLQLHQGPKQVVSLGEFTDGDITDPFGGNTESYRRCAAKIENALKSFLTLLKEDGK